MKSNQYDLAVFGSTPSALFLAALMAEDQSRRIVLVHNPATTVRLMRGLDLSVGAMTRPETWRRLAEGVEETRRRLAAGNAGHCLERGDVVMMRSGEAGRAVLGHLRAVAGAHGLAIERFAAPAGPAWEEAGIAAHAILFRDAWRLDGDRAAEGLAGWHGRAGVRRIGIGEVEELLFTRDGDVRMTVGGERVVGGEAVLADDEMILEHANEPDFKGVLTAGPNTGLLTEPVAERLPGRVPVVLGEGFAALQGASGALAAICEGPGGPGAARLLRYLPMFDGARLAGRSRFVALGAADGAAAVGRGKTRRCWIVGGLGETGFFLMPGLARFIAGRPSADEKAYWHARALTRDPGAPVADVGVPHTAGLAA